MERAYVELAVQGIEVHRVLGMRGVEAVSALFRYEVEVELDLPLPDADALIGAPATLLMRDTSKQERTVTGIVAEASAQAYDDHRGRASLVIRPAVWIQSLGRDCYASQDVDVRKVVDDVLADFHGQYRWELTRSYPTYPYRVQYREDDWTYVARFLEEEGIYFWFDHDASSVLVFSDSSTSAPDMTGGALLPWVRESALRPERDAITEIGSTSAASTGRFEQRSFDLRRPTVPIGARAGAGAHEVYDAPGGGTGMEAIITAHVNDQREANIASRAGATGRAHSIRPAPGFVLEVTGAPLGKLDGRWLVTGVEVSGDDHLPCTTRFSAIRADVPFRPLPLTPEAKQAGLQLGTVIGPDGQEVHPDELARVRVILHWDRLGTHDEKGGTWMRVAQRGAPGSMLFPRMGWNVATFNEEGTVDAPSVIWRIHDGEHVPEYQLPANMTRVVWKTATTPANGTTNEMYFEDRAGAEEMFINASRDMTYRVLDAKYETVRNDSWRTVGVNHDLTIHESLDERVIKDQQIHIGGNEKVTVSGSRIKTVSGNEQEKVGGARKLKVGASHLAHVMIDRTLKVGGSMADVTPQNINLTAKDATTIVSGSVIKVASQDISEAAGKDTVQVISGAKLETAQRDRALVVREEWTERVGGSVLLVSNNKYLDTADTTSRWTIAAAMASTAPEVHLEAVDSIRFTCGDSVLTITPKAITVTGASLNLSGATLDADSGVIEHN